MSTTATLTTPLRAGDVLVANVTAGNIVARVTHALGQGGFGCVSAATCVSNSRGPSCGTGSSALALKAMWSLADASVEDAWMQRLPRHSNIVPYYGIAEVRTSTAPGPSPTCAVLMTRRGVCSLRHLLGTGRITKYFGRTHPEYFLVRLLAPVLDALMAAHNAGVCHSDTKFDNVTVNTVPDMSTVRAEIIDWGLAVSSTRWAVNQGAGTAHCQPPERADPSASGSRYDPVKADVFEFYFLLREALMYLEAETGSATSSLLSHLVKCGMESNPQLRPTPEQAMEDLRYYLGESAPVGAGDMQIGEFVRLDAPLIVLDEEARSRMPTPVADAHVRRQVFEYTADMHSTEEFESMLVPRESLLYETPAKTARAKVLAGNVADRPPSKIVDAEDAEDAEDVMDAAGTADPENSADAADTEDAADRRVEDLEERAFGGNQQQFAPSSSPLPSPSQPQNTASVEEKVAGDAGSADGLNAWSPVTSESSFNASLEHDPPPGGVCLDAGSLSAKDSGTIASNGGRRTCGHEGQAAVHAFNEGEHPQWNRMLNGDIEEAGAPEVVIVVGCAEAQTGETANTCVGQQNTRVRARRTALRALQHGPCAAVNASIGMMLLGAYAAVVVLLWIYLAVAL